MVRVLIWSVFALSPYALAEQDPTAPLSWVAPQEKQASQKIKKTVQYRLPTLQSIVCRSEEPCYAILNDQIVAKGDSIRGYHIKAIQAESVTLSKSSKQWKLALFSLDIKNN